MKIDEKLIHILKICGIVYWEYDLINDILIKDDDTLHLLTLDESLTRFSKIISNKDFSKLLRLKEQVLNRATEIDDVYVFYIDKNNNARHVRIEMLPYRYDENGKLTHYLGFAKDVTEIVNLSDTNKQVLFRNEYILNSIDSKLIFFNNEIEIIWDNFQTDIQHKNASDQQKLYERFGLHFDVFENLIKSVQASSKEEECVIESENGKFYQLHVNLACEKNNIKGYILRIDNVTKERRYLNQLEEYKNSLQIAKERAEQSDKLKSTFLANMSHEIRTPLNAIIGFSDLIASTEDEDEKKQYAEIITTNSDLLLRLINDILDLSKIEAGIMPLEKFEVDFISLFDEIVNLFRLRIDNSNIDFIIEPHKYDKLIVFMDKQRFTQVVCNFLTNAIKFTKQGYIKVGYNVLQGDVLEVFVEDTGVGIEENKHNKVFRRFEKLNSFAQGTGLGLAIVKAITEVDGGEVGFDSIPGSGSRFWARKKLSIFEILPKNI